MGASFHILANCPYCNQEFAFAHPVNDGEILHTPPVAFVQCANVACNRKYKVTLRVEVEKMSKRPKPPAGFGPLKIADGD